MFFACATSFRCVASMVAAASSAVEASDQLGNHCPICLNWLETNGKVVATNCCHVFHKTCLDKWFDKKNTCPICRTTLWSPYRTLHEAADDGKIDGLKALLAAGIYIEQIDDDGNTPLDIALNRGDIEMANMLMQKGAWCKVKHFFKAILYGHISIVRFVLGRRADIINARDDRKDTPLHLAAARGHYEIVSLLLKKDPDINARNNKQETPLHVAVSCENHQIVSLLLEKGANPNAQNNVGRTPLHLFVPHAAQSIAIAKELLQAKADVNAKDVNGLTPLHVAAISWDIAKINLLLDAGANINARDNNGRTPLDCTSLDYLPNSLHDDIVTLLKQRGAYYSWGCIIS